MSIYFRLSGVLSGINTDYTFEQNPMDMSEVTPKSKHTILPLLVGENIYQRSLTDNVIRRMSWEITSYAVYSGLKRFAVREVSNGEPPIVKFWDGQVYDFQGADIQVIDVYGTPIAGDYNNWRVELQFKPASNLDNLKKML